MWYIGLVILYYVVAAILGNSFIQYSIIGPINTFYAMSGIGVLSCFKFKNNKVSFLQIAKLESTTPEQMIMRRWRWNTLIFLFLIMLYVVLSYFDCFRNIFHIKDVEFDKSYVFRHSVLIFIIPMIYGLTTRIKIHWKAFINLFGEKLWLVGWITVNILSVIVGRDALFRSLVFALGTALFLKKKESIISWIILFFSIYQTGLASLASIFAALICCFFLVDINIFLRFVKYNWGLKLWFLLAIGLLCFVLSYSSFISFITKDANTIWRWDYWLNEFRIFIRSYGFGVGYGTAYASNSILYETAGISMFMKDSGNGLFVVTQHSSVINIIYRLGTVGILLFIMLTIVHPLQFLGKIFKDSGRENQKFLQWALCNYIYNYIIIFTNPGLESPRSGFGFFVIYAIFVGGLIVIGEQRNEL